MSNFDNALDLATALARFMFPDVSDNRSPLPRITGREMTPDEVGVNIRRQLTKDALDRLRCHAQCPTGPAGWSRANAVAYGGHVFANGRVGNCMEISCAAAWWLETKAGSSDWSLAGYTAGDHVFCVVGAVPDPTVSFDRYPGDAAIFDGWAQIACLAQNYPMKWSAKMSEWSASSQPVYLPSPTGGGFGDATAWRGVVNGAKQVYC